MLFKRKSKEPADVKISELNFISDEAKEAFKVLEFETTAQIRDKNADNLYLDYCVESGGVADRSILYEMRCAVYFASNVKPEPKKLRWWYWKDTNTENEELFDEE
jgi:hypothetical protein